MNDFNTMKFETTEEAHRGLLTVIQEFGVEVLKDLGPAHIALLRDGPFMLQIRKIVALEDLENFKCDNSRINAAVKAGLAASKKLQP